MGSGLDPERAVRAVKSPVLLNKYLHDICKSEGIKSSGMRKASMQAQIEDKLRRYIRNNDRSGFKKLEAAIFQNYQFAAGEPYPGTSAAAARNGNGNGATALQAANQNNLPNMQHPTNVVYFKQNPFYSIKQVVGVPKTCEIMTAHRNTVDWKVSLNDFPFLIQLEQDPRFRVYLFCANDNHGPQEVAFPHQSEIKVNGGDVKANLRGLKNKPGSTRPVDLTPYLRLKPPQYQNRVEFTYALTAKKFYAGLWLCKVETAERLAEMINKGAKIKKETVVNRMVQAASDPDIEATSMVLSLKCPLSTLRISVPIRSLGCKHNQCFDSVSYLQLQEQAPTWQCPICNVAAPYHSLVIDEYVQDILDKTPKSLDQVTVEPNGKWSTQALTPAPSYDAGNGYSHRYGNGAGDFSDDDLIEVTHDGRPTASATPNTNGNGNGAMSSLTAPTPPISNNESREQSAGTVMSPQGTKRKIIEVVDLLSSDEDEEPPTKKRTRESGEFAGAISVGSTGAGGGGGGSVQSVASATSSDVLPPYDPSVYMPKGRPFRN